MRKSILFLLFSVFTLTAFTQDLDELFDERKKLIKETNELNLENNAFFGGKSKDDLREIISSLKELVLLDNKIIQKAEVMNTTQKFQSRNLEDAVVGANFRMNELETANEKLRERIKELENKVVPVRKEKNSLRLKYYFSLTGMFIFMFLTGISLYFFLRIKKRIGEA